MKILLLGSGGREHALAWKIAQSPKVEKLFIAPGNAGTSAVGENVAIKATDFPALKAFALKEKVDMIVVGPEDPLVEGIYDNFAGDAATQHIASLALLPRVPNWKAARSLPRVSWNVMASPPPATKASMPKIWKKDSLSLKPLKHPMC